MEENEIVEVDPEAETTGVETGKKKSAAQEEGEKLFLEGEALYKEKNYDAAIEKWELAAQKGNAYAQYELGCIYQHGSFGKKIDPRMAQDLYKDAATWFQSAAAQGNARAQYMLGSCYALGRGVERDKKKSG